MHKTGRVPLRGRRGVRARFGLSIIPINHSSQSFPPFHQYLARHSRHALAAELVTKHMFTPALRRKLERMKQEQLALQANYASFEPVQRMAQTHVARKRAGMLASENPSGSALVRQAPRVLSWASQRSQQPDENDHVVWFHRPDEGCSSQQ